MGFEELGDDELLGWIGGWIGKVSGTVPFTADGATEQTGTITVSVHGDLQRLRLDAAAAQVPPEQLGAAIELAYVEAYREALRQVGLIFDRLESDLADNPSMLLRIKEIRVEHQDRDGLRRMLAHRRDAEQEAAWDPVADPLNRRT